MSRNRLTIRVTGREESIPLESFLTVARNTLAILQGVDSTFSENHKPSVKWRIENVSMNSPLTMTIFGEALEERRPNEVIEAYTAGVREVEAGTHSIPAHYTITTLESLKKMTSVLNDGIADVTIYTDDITPIGTTQKTAATVDSLIGPEEYDEYTTLEGRLEMLTVHRGLNFNIYDVLHKTRISCQFPRRLVDTAKQAFNQRVEVTGKARFKRSGLPFSIQVSDIHILRERPQLPQMSDLEGINITNGVDPTEYVRGLRDAE